MQTAAPKILPPDLRASLRKELAAATTIVDLKAVLAKMIAGGI